jgi:ketosteroid isomerase-like protein
MPIREHVAAFVQQVEAGEFVEAMQAYYADDASMQENNEPPRVGLPALIAHERRALAIAGRVQARCLSPLVVDGDRVVIHWEFVFKSSAGAMLRFEELAFQTWRDDRIASERFFYDPGQMRPEVSAS